MFGCASGRVSKAIQRPSGDQRGVPVSGPPMEVSCTRLDPSASARQISKFPERVDWKTIRLPSGEYCGPSSTMSEKINFSGFPARWPAPIGIRQIFSVQIPVQYARRCPCILTAGPYPRPDQTDTLSGVPPPAEIRHNPQLAPPRFEEKM